MTEVCIAFCTAEDEPSANALAHGMLEARLAACVNLLPGIASLYWWQDKVQSSNEVLMLIKTTADRVAELKAFVTEHHSYDTPELLVLPASDGLARYLAWVQKETRPPHRDAGS